MTDSADTNLFPESSGSFDNTPAPFLPDDEDYRIKLPVFEGPIDLLLYLIRKKELDIHEISLAEVAREFLDYVELIKLIDIERAGDFIVLASTLMKIKSRSLFESQEAEEALVMGDDPRASLIQYLKEYEKLGGVAEILGEKEEERRGVFPRGGEKERLVKESDHKDTAPDFMIFDLLSAMQDVLKITPKTPTHNIEMLNVTSSMKQKEIIAELKRVDSIDFVEFVKNQPKIIIVVTFVAVLELIKKNKIAVRQSKQFARILIEKWVAPEPVNAGEEALEDAEEADGGNTGDEVNSDSGEDAGTEHAGDRGGEPESPSDDAIDE